MMFVEAQGIEWSGSAGEMNLSDPPPLTRPVFSLLRCDSMQAGFYVYYSNLRVDRQMK